MGPLVGASSDLPSEYSEAPYAKGIFEILVGAGTVTVERHRKTMDAKSGHDKTSDLNPLEWREQTQ
jgi:hypothetical protein